MPPGPAAPGWLRDTPLAHRGLHDGDVLENTLPAFAAARDAGYGVELDVHATRDAVPVVVHDRELARASGPVRVSRLTVDELRSVPLLGSSELVPTLAESLAVLGPTTPVMVECKSFGATAGGLARVVAEVLDHHAGPWCVAGFHPGTARWFRRHRPEAVRVVTAGALTGRRLPGVLRRGLAALLDLRAAAPHALSYALDALPSPTTDAWRAEGGTLVTWTVTDDAELARAREVADNVIFEQVRPTPPRR